jgi:predicted AAA+ superfamily ATPase
LENIYNTVITKDILNTGKVSNASRLRRIMAFMASSIGSEISVKKISDMMKTEGLTIRPQVVDDYLDAFMNAYIWHKASRYDLRGRKMLSTKGKYYIVDLGLRNYLCPPRENDFGHILENVVYLELLRRGFTVYVGQIDTRVDGKSITKEVDFVAENQEHREYYQITYTTHHPETLARELAPLKLIKDNHPKYILSTDAGSYNYDGIKQINVWNWLAEREQWP